ncbi:Uncharacterised protein [Mycobacteroides abscessus subsp. massiliense]|nr:Uncharacterised protein [Mycobacteroides abscessus subsp. massiliense]
MHREPGQRIEGAERLVEQQQLRFRDESAGQRNPLRLPAGECQRPGLCLIGEADLVQCPVNARKRLTPGQFGPSEAVQHIVTH